MPNAILGDGNGLAVAVKPAATAVTPSDPALAVGLHPSSPVPAGENHLGEVGGSTVVAVAAFTRPANTTNYAAGQAVQSAAASALILPIARKAAGTGRITRVRLTKSSSTTTNAQFRVHLFKNAPATLPADGAAFTPSGALDHLGVFPVVMNRTFTDGAKGIGSPEVGSYVTFDTAAGSTNLYALVEVTVAYAPASGETFTLAVEADRD